MKRQSSSSYSSESYEGNSSSYGVLGRGVTGSFSKNFNSGYSSDGGSSTDVPPASKRKYAPSIDSLSDIGKTKKRFVWPESLHKDFISAVFDVGLKAANSKLLHDMLSDSPSITIENLKASLQKYRLFRDRTKFDHLSYYDTWLRDSSGGGSTGSKISPRSEKARQQSSSSSSGSGSGSAAGASSSSSSSQAAADVAAQRQAREAAKQAAAEQAQAHETAANLRRQIELINKAITSQTQFLTTLKASISKQTKIHSQLVSKLALIDPASASASASVSVADSNSRGASEIDEYPREENITHMSESLAQSISAALELQGKAAKTNNLLAGPNPRAELQIMSEMRSHMDMHRQLLMRREDQLSMHGGVGVITNGGVGPSNNGGDRGPFNTNSVPFNGATLLTHQGHQQINQGNQQQHQGQLPVHDPGLLSDNNSELYGEISSEGSGDRQYSSAIAAATDSSMFNPDLGWDADDPLDTNLFSFLLEPYGGPNE